MDIETCAELLDVGVVDHVALRGLQEDLAVPQVVGHVITRHPKRKVFLPVSRTTGQSGTFRPPRRVER